MQFLDHNSGDRAGAFGMEKIRKDVVSSNKRQRVVSREEELLMEHGLLDDSPGSKNNGPFASEIPSDDKTLSQEGRHPFGLPLLGSGNNDDVRHPQSASEAKSFIHKFQPAKDEDTFHGNALEGGYLINPSQDTLRGNIFMSARDQNSHAPIHLRGSERGFSQGVDSGSFWHNNPSDKYLFQSDDRFGSHESRPAFYASRDSSHTSMQQSTEVPILIEGERVHRPITSKVGRFEEHHLSGGSAIRNFSQLRSESTREWQQEDSLKTIEELHMDFVHQQQKKMHKQVHSHPVPFQEETYRSDEGSNALSLAHQPHLQAVSRSQSSYNQDYQLQSTQFSEQGIIQDQNERNTRTGESMSKAVWG
ncbi:hypothetical protein KI387_017648 [Taxus chinensis]|uniref:Uncharacterized protein n=1 Tax=Taxus chinensis TaxID=29808 RepID=A0AA38GJN4_TAXCH|nr:hypothetical protein KI387_017648 [Taxus chinensis]